MSKIIREKGIKSGTLRRAFNQALSEKTICKNMILITLAAMENREYSSEEKLKLEHMLTEHDFDIFHIHKVLPQITEDYFPSSEQIKKLFEVISEEYQYKEGIVKDSLLKSVNLEDLTQSKTENKKVKYLTARQLKKYIYDSEQINIVLESIGCHNIRLNQGKTEYRCSNFDGDSIGAICVENNPYVGVINYTRQNEFKNNADIIDLVKYNRNCSFKEAMDFLHSVLGLSDIDISKLDFHNIELSRPEPEKKTDSQELIPIDEMILNQYAPLLHIEWIHCGITTRTRDKFDIRYSYKEKSIIIPIRKWDDGSLVGMNKRTTINHCEEFGIKKYQLSKGYKKTKNVYGVWENKKSIEEKGYCVIFEGEKSVLKRDSLNDPSGLSIHGKSISETQVAIILSLNIEEVILALDEDVDVDEVRYMAEKFYRKKKVSYIFDSLGLLEKKQSPADLRNVDYMKLFDNRVIYDDGEHKKFLESMSNKN